MSDADNMMTTPREECGVVGIWGADRAAHFGYLALHALQHRGQESAGLVSLDGDQMRVHLGQGLVQEVFDADTLARLQGRAAVGHVRYSTTGRSALENAQPLKVDFRRGSVALAHNGNLVNARAVREELEQAGAIFQTTIDTEVVLHLIARQPTGSNMEALSSALGRVQGAYSLVMLTGDALLAARDPNGFRPLSLGRLEDGGWVVASETCAFDLLGATYEREVMPGEVIRIDDSGVQSKMLAQQAEQKSLCIFELIYFSRPNSFVYEESVYDARVRMGAKLAETHPAEADVVIAVPDSSNGAALGYAQETGLPFRHGLIRSHYIGRTFIEPNRAIRDFGVRLKYSPVREVLDGQRVVVVDDSIVRGSTCTKIVRLIREAGAREVHIRVACPPWRHPCNYGIDTPQAATLIAHSRSIEEIADALGADSLGYLGVRDMLETVPGHSFCTACFTGDYPVRFGERAQKELFDHRSASGAHPSLQS